ncbi:MAG: hypothetical protein E1N59_1989 [Puniceicoccaceae bacterium 5H]|nr:MAG: hypothetical protein E1N59_1989 [Puniceicoccaceae bacterium 5H]
MPETLPATAERRTPPEHLVAAARDLAPTFAERALPLDRDGAFPDKEFRLLHEAGLLRAPLSRDHGGAGLGLTPEGMLPLLQILKHIGRGNLSVGRLYEGHVNALRLLEDFASPAQLQRYAADVAAGHLFAVWNTEAKDEGVRFEPLGPNRYRLHGAKIFASGAGHITRPIVNGALPDGGWQMSVVPMDVHCPPLDDSRWQPLGMEASQSYRVDFSGIELDAGDLIGQPGDYTHEPWFSGGAIRFAAVQLGGAEALIETTRQHLRERQRTESPHQQARMAEMALAIESGNLWLEGAARHASEAARDPERFLAYSRLMRSAIEQICLQVLERAQRSIGLQGMLQPHPLERLIRDLTMYLRQPAPDKTLTEAGRYLLEHTTPIESIWYDHDPDPFHA